MIQKRLAALRDVMRAQHVEALIIPTSDFHDTEYVSDHFKARAYYSGFTGSAGTLVVTLDGGALWTDGRYFIQAARQLEGSGLELEKIGQPGTPGVAEYLLDHLHPGDTVAVDGRTITYKDYEEYLRELAPHDISLIVDQDIPGMAWENRPALPHSQTFQWDLKYAGESTADKLQRVREYMKKAHASRHVTSKIDEIAWLFNMRADDIPCFPAALAYAEIGEKDGTLYIDASRLDDATRKILEENHIAVKDYDAVYEDLSTWNEPVLVQEDFINSRIGAGLAKPVWKKNPVTLMKAVKNEAEQAGARAAHIKDGAAVIRFWKWLEESLARKDPITEEDASEKVHALRAQQPGYLEDSFNAISAYKENAAMPHYSSSRDHEVIIEPKGLYLLDSGGQYIEGTTDITRTFVAGELSDEEREGFTRVLKGHIQLAKARYLEGARGYNLDVLTRAPLWNIYMDFNHGTGHGVGALSSVHEGPNSYYWKVTPTRRGDTVLEEGMITSDEPGLYLEGKFGIRHENLLLTKKDVKNEFGQFYRSEVLTMVPFDVRGLDLTMMAPDEIQWLNDYHQEVFEKVSPLLDEEEVLWLKEKTSPVHA